MDRLQLEIANVHCNDCEDSIKHIIAKIFIINEAETADELTSPDSVELNQDDDEDEKVQPREKRRISLLIKGSELDLVSHEPGVLNAHVKKILKSLTKSGFDVLSWELFSNESLQLEDNVETKNAAANRIVSFFTAATRYKEKRMERAHLKNCKSCREEQENKKASSSSRRSSTGFSSDSTLKDTPQLVENPKEFRAVLSIGGMTCASCSSAISETINDVLTSHNIPITPNETFSVNLIANSAVLIIPNKQVINQIITSIEEKGYEATLLEVLPVERSVNYKITAILGGITCAACASSISSAVNELPIVLESGINVVSKTGMFIVESNDQKTLDTLREAIEDCGFDFELIGVEKINYTSGKIQSRAINLSVDGMFCSHCPDVINDYLESFGEAIVVNDPITLSHPFIKFTYIPSDKLTIRKILYNLNHLSPTGIAMEETEDAPDGVFKCKLIHQVSLDEHLRKLARAETMRIARRLVIAVAFAIPTFIFGIVAMSLLPKHNAFRMWVEEPIWAGNASRNTWILFILATPVYFFAADIFHRKALKELKSLWFYKNSFKRRFLRFGSMSLLMSLGTTVAYVASIILLGLSAHTPRESQGYSTTYFDSVVFLSFFLLIGRLLESFSKSKTADAIANLSALKSNLATLVETSDNQLKFGKDQTIEIDYLEIGDFIRIPPGESPPVDCIIAEGTSEFDESALTGESKPVKHFPGHQIFAGTVNSGTNSIVGKVSALDGSSLIDQIVNTVRDGQLRKAPIERTADLLTGYFVPVIILLAVLVWVIWLSLGLSGALPPSYLDIDVGGWVIWSLQFAIAVFVIACPCGIGLAAPTALFVGAGLAAKNGILAKGGGVAFQDGANVNVVCFDKTGTLTFGDLRVTDYAYYQNESDDSNKNEIIKRFAFQIARDLELASKHPLARSVKSFIEQTAQKLGISLSQNKVPKVEVISGRGLKGEVVLDNESLHANNNDWIKYNPTEALLGNEQLFQENGITMTEKQTSLLTQWKTESKSVMLVALKCELLFNTEEYVPILFMAARDEIRPETKDVVKKLQQRNIECWMISGDNKITADAIAKEIGIKNVVSEVLPDEKASKVKWLQKTANPGKASIVAMVGDGINDAPALAAADVGIALSSGSDLAVTSSDFILLNKNYPLSTLLILFELSRKVFGRVKFNFGWALVYNCIGIPIAAGVIYPYHNSRLDPVWASAAMAASSVSVVLSSLALKFYRPSKVALEETERVEFEAVGKVFS